MIGEAADAFMETGGEPLALLESPVNAVECSDIEGRPRPEKL
eukprot:SAG22_NODE_6014_length_915_cov_4.595588_1_plen_42_part_00